MRADRVRLAVRAVACIAILAVVLVLAVCGYMQTLAHPSCWLTH